MFIETEMDYKFSQVIHLIDSEIVKAMIEKGSYGFKTFVANRIGEIQSSTTPDKWYWIPGSLNIADWVIRGKCPKELQEGSLWRRGADFLKLPFEEWPIHSQSVMRELPEQTNAVYTTNVEEKETLANRLNINRFRNLQFVLNTTARILKLYKIYKRTETNLTNIKELTSDDVKKAEYFWIKAAQLELI